MRLGIGLCLATKTSTLAPPEGFAFVVDGSGAYVVDGDGAYIIAEAE